MDHFAKNQGETPKTYVKFHHLREAKKINFFFGTSFHDLSINPLPVRPHGTRDTGVVQSPPRWVPRSPHGPRTPASSARSWRREPGRAMVRPGRPGQPRAEVGRLGEAGGRWGWGSGSWFSWLHQFGRMGCNLETKGLVFQ